MIERSVRLLETGSETIRDCLQCRSALFFVLNLAQSLEPLAQRNLDGYCGAFARKTRKGFDQSHGLRCFNLQCHSASLLMLGGFSLSVRKTLKRWTSGTRITAG